MTVALYQAMQGMEGVLCTSELTQSQSSSFHHLANAEKNLVPFGVRVLQHTSLPALAVQCTVPLSARR